MPPNIGDALYEVQLCVVFPSTLRSGNKSSNWDGAPYLERPRGTNWTPQQNNIMGETIMKVTKYYLSELLSEGAARV